MPEDNGTVSLMFWRKEKYYTHSNDDSKINANDRHSKTWKSSGNIAHYSTTCQN